MNTDELTQIATAHQSAISRHDVEMAEIRATLNTVGQRLDAVGERLDTVGERLDTIDIKLDRVAEQQEANAQQIALNREDIAILTARILELGNLVADYLQGRSRND